MYSEVLDRYWQCNWPLLFPVPCMLNFVFVNYINTKYSSVFTGTILTRPRGLLNHIHIFLLYVFKKYLPERLWHSIACYAWVTCDFLFVVLCFFIYGSFLSFLCLWLLYWVISWKLVVSQTNWWLFLWHVSQWLSFQGLVFNSIPHVYCKEWEVTNARKRGVKIKLLMS